MMRLHAINRVGYYLEIDSGRQDAQQSADSIDRDERKTVFVQTKHHLQTTCNRLNVFIVLDSPTE